MKWLLLLPFLLTLAFAQPERVALESARFDQHPGESLPLSLPFTDDRGRAVRLGEYFNDKPVILLLGYYECPQLCAMVYHDVADALKSLPLKPGRDYEVVSISIDPRETTSLAAGKRIALTSMFGDQSAAQGLHFLTGTQASIDSVTDSVGFRYTYHEETRQYAHPTGFVVASPQGRIMRYFIGLSFPAAEVNASLAQAREGTVAPPATNVVLRCFGYDPTIGRHDNIVRIALRTGGTLTVLALLGFIFATLRRDPATKRATP